MEDFHCCSHQVIELSKKYFNDWNRSRIVRERVEVLFDFLIRLKAFVFVEPATASCRQINTVTIQIRTESRVINPELIGNLLLFQSEETQVVQPLVRC